MASSRARWTSALSPASKAMWCQTPTRPSPLGRPGRLGEVPAPAALAVEHEPRAVGAGSRRARRTAACSSSVVNERAPSSPRMRCSAGMSSASAISGASVRVGHHQLDLVVLRVAEDEALRLRRVEPQHLAVHLVGDQPVHPVLERVVGRDAQDEAVDVAVARDAGLGLVELEERDDAARVALLVAEVGVVAERRLEVERVLDEPQAHHATPEVDVGGDVAGDACEVMRSLQRLLHADSSLGPGVATRNLHNRNSRCQYFHARC